MAASPAAQAAQPWRKRIVLTVFSNPRESHWDLEAVASTKECFAAVLRAIPVAAQPPRG
jgi:hypothetical protein